MRVSGSDSRTENGSREGSSMNWKRYWPATAIAVVLFWLAGVAVGSPAAGAAALELESTSVTLTKPDGDLQHAAGAHPDFRFFFAVRKQGSLPVASLRNMGLRLPPGLFGNPLAVPRCGASEFLDVTIGPSPLCPTKTQVGTARLVTVGKNNIYLPIYNLAHGTDMPAKFGLVYYGVPVYITPEVRPTDFGVTAGSLNSNQGEDVLSADIRLWGVPADPVHDSERGLPGFPTVPGFPISVDIPMTPFMRNPTSCSEESQTFVAEGNSWEEPNLFAVSEISSEPFGRPLAFENCEDLGFAPTMTASSTSSSADAPTGLEVDINVPQNDFSVSRDHFADGNPVSLDSPDGRATSDVRKVVTTLPEGMTVSASSAQGLGACSLAQIGIGSNDPPTCPDSAKIGTVLIDTPVLEEDLEGVVYLAKQKENPFNATLAMYMAVKGPGFFLKLPGRVDADPNTGRLTATFDNTPQLPFEHLHLELKSGARAPLVNPRTCGTYAIKGEFVPWSGTAPVVAESTFQVDQGCAAASKFSPGLKAGTTNPQAGAFSPFLLRVTREDGEQNLAKLSATLPEGLLAKLAGVAICSDAQASTGECPTASQVGKVTVGAGSGTNPTFVPEAGKPPTAAYLAGPYKGAPYSLVVKVPAQAGPFDLGTVAVRNALHINPVTTQVTSVSDPLPQILEGIPIAYRDVRVEVDRPQFIVNPTGCEAKKITSTIGGSGGATASPSAPFAAVNCERLGFKPKLALKFTGKTHRSAHPALKATLTMPKGGANIDKAVVLLPQTEFIDNAHITTPCTRVQFDAGKCPKSSILGTATATSPLLDQPLSGPVYFRSNGGARELPDLVADLDGPIHVTLVGFIDSVKTGKETGRVRTRFLGIPDAPVSKFVLRMKGGDEGLLVNNTELCRIKPRAKAEFTGQNGKRSVSRPRVKLGCGKSSRKR